MTRLALAFALVAAPVFAGDLYQHFQLPMVDAYVDSTVSRQSDIPGLGGVAHSLAVSLSTIDNQTSCFAVYVKVQLEDGTIQPIRALIDRNGSIAAATFALVGKPAKVIEFYVMRLHPEPLDSIVR